jgi:hypothetical protein
MKILLLMAFCFLFSCKGDDKIPTRNTWVIQSLKIDNKEVKNIYSDTFVFYQDSSCRLAQITQQDSNEGISYSYENSIDRENFYTIIESRSKLRGRYKFNLFEDKKIGHYTLHMVSDSIDVWCVSL